MLNVSTYSRKDLTEEFRSGEQITGIEYDIEGYDHASPGKNVFINILMKNTL